MKSVRTITLITSVGSVDFFVGASDRKNGFLDVVFDDGSKRTFTINRLFTGEVIEELEEGDDDGC